MEADEIKAILPVGKLGLAKLTHADAVVVDLVVKLRVFAVEAFGDVNFVGLRVKLKVVTALFLKLLVKLVEAVPVAVRLLLFAVLEIGVVVVFVVAAEVVLVVEVKVIVGVVIHVGVERILRNVLRGHGRAGGDDDYKHRNEQEQQRRNDDVFFVFGLEPRKGLFRFFRTDELSTPCTLTAEGTDLLAVGNACTAFSAEHHAIPPVSV